jgi:hypothetical protein
MAAIDYAVLGKPITQFIGLGNLRAALRHEKWRPRDQGQIVFTASYNVPDSVRGGKGRRKMKKLLVGLLITWVSAFGQVATSHEEETIVRTAYAKLSYADEVRIILDAL